VTPRTWPSTGPWGNPAVAIVDPYSVLIWSGSINPTTGSPSITPPAGYIWVVTDVVAWQVLGTNSSVTVQETSSGVTIVELVSTSTNPYSHWSGRQVIPAGMAVQAKCAVNAANLRVSGYQLSTGP
jgi:hypothetical protein